MNRAHSMEDIVYWEQADLPNHPLQLQQTEFEEQDKGEVKEDNIRQRRLADIAHALQQIQSAENFLLSRGVMDRSMDRILMDLIQVARKLGTNTQSEEIPIISDDRFQRFVKGYAQLAKLITYYAMIVPETFKVALLEELGSMAVLTRCIVDDARGFSTANFAFGRMITYQNMLNEHVDQEDWRELEAVKELLSQMGDTWIAFETSSILGHLLSNVAHFM